MEREPEHHERFRVAWVDTDAGGRIHFTTAFRWAEAAETGLRRRLGILDGWGDYPRRHVEADFHQVLVFEDEVDVFIHPQRVGRTSITWTWRVERAGELCVDGTMVVVHVDEGGAAAAIPDRVRSVLS